MGKVYIRSQNREKLVLFGGGLNSISCIPYYKNHVKPNEDIAECYSVSIAGADNCHYLGFYESKERCLEILDEIQKECESYYKSTCSLNIPDMLFDMPKVYQMPEK